MMKPVSPSWAVSLLFPLMFCKAAKVKTGLQVKLWLEEWWWASQWAIAAVIMAQLHSQRVSLLVILNKNKNKPREKQRLHYCLHCSTVFTIATAKGSQLFTSSFHRALIYFPLYPLSVGVKAILHWRSSGSVIQCLLKCFEEQQYCSEHKGI